MKAIDIALYFIALVIIFTLSYLFGVMVGGVVITQPVIHLALANGTFIAAAYTGYTWFIGGFNDGFSRIGEIRYGSRRLVS